MSCPLQMLLDWWNIQAAETPLPNVSSRPSRCIVQKWLVQAFLIVQTWLMIQGTMDLEALGQHMRGWLSGVVITSVWQKHETEYDSAVFLVQTWVSSCNCCTLKLHLSLRPFPSPSCTSSLTNPASSVPVLFWDLLSKYPEFSWNLKRLVLAPNLLYGWSNLLLINGLVKFYSFYRRIRKNSFLLMSCVFLVLSCNLCPYSSPSNET